MVHDEVVQDTGTTEEHLFGFEAGASGMMDGQGRQYSIDAGLGWASPRSHTSLLLRWRPMQTWGARISTDGGGFGIAVEALFGLGNESAAINLLLTLHYGWDWNLG